MRTHSPWIALPLAGTVVKTGADMKGRLQSIHAMPRASTGKSWKLTLRQRFPA
jgi:hypothetical protein